MRFSKSRLMVGLLGAALATTASILAAAQVAFPPWGLSLNYVDTSVKPGVDFFRYSNGGWLKMAVIPPDRSVAGVNLELDKGNEARLRSIVTELSAKPDASLTV